MDLISVIVPVYNVEQYLIRCVDSIRKQTYENIEIILVDDGSPDNCPELCEKLNSEDLRIKVVHKINGGLGLARNSGLDVSSGTYVAFIDSDDWITDDHIENLYREAKRTGADAVIGSFTSVTSDGCITPHPVKLKQMVYEGAAVREEIVLPLIGANVDSQQDVQLEPSSCMNLYRMDIVAREGIRFPSEKVAVSEDAFFNMDFFCHSDRVAVINETGYCYFENLGSISRKYDAGRLERTVRFYEAMKEKLSTYGLEDEAAFRLERTFLMNIRVAVRMIVQSDMSKKQKIREIRRTLGHRQVADVLKEYPIGTYIPAMRILAVQMRRGNAYGVYWLVKIREFAKKIPAMKAFLKQVGIGK